MIDLYLSFVFASIVLILIPGPNVLIIISTSISSGRKKGLRTVFGTSSAMSLQLILAALATMSAVEFITHGFEGLRWAGIIFLLYLGISHFYKMVVGSSTTSDTNLETSPFHLGFFVSLTNPKTIIFFGAFLPQFVSNQADYPQQIAVLSVTFLILATVIDSLYASFAGHLHSGFKTHHLDRLKHAISGALYIGVSIWLAFPHD